jgi:hypothetical protein
MKDLCKNPWAVIHGISWGNWWKWSKSKPRKGWLTWWSRQIVEKPQGDNLVMFCLRWRQAKCKGRSMKEATLQESWGVTCLCCPRTTSLLRPPPLTPRFNPTLPECQIQCSSHTTHTLWPEHPCKKRKDRSKKEDIKENGVHTEMNTLMLTTLGACASKGLEGEVYTVCH